MTTGRGPRVPKAAVICLVKAAKGQGPAGTSWLPCDPDDSSGPTDARQFVPALGALEERDVCKRPEQGEGNAVPRG